MDISMYSYFSDAVEQYGIKKAAEYAANLGFSSVEFIDCYPRHHVVADEATAREYKNILDSYGLRVSCFSVGTNVIIPGNPAFDSEAAVSYLIQSAQVAAILGSPFLHHTLIVGLKHTPDTYENDFDAVTERLLPYTRRVADACNSLGLTTLYEPQGIYVNGKNNFPAFYRRMKSYNSNVGVCGDTGNPLFLDWRPEEFYRELAEEIKHVHIKNYRLAQSDSERSRYISLSGVRFSPSPLDDGDIDLQCCMNILKESGYTGAISLENEYTGEITSCLKADLSALRKY
ncbi:MAG: sugar phosphate isomerase/epimerase [Clostridia bacterium]|nr:sugar phosphate isomerase/epimerase [Clostridia bacterium]